MIGFCLALGCSMAVTAAVLIISERRAIRQRLGFAIASGTAAGHVVWFAVNDFLAAGSSTVAPWSGAWSSLVATVTAFLAPREAGHWIVIVLFTAAIIQALTEVPGRRTVLETASDPSQESLERGWVWLIWSPLYAGALLRLLWGSVYLTRQWSGLIASGVVIANVIPLTLIVAMGRQTISPRDRTIRLSLTLFTVTISGIVIGMSGSAVYAQLTLMAAASLLICVLSSWWQTDTANRQRTSIGMILLVVSYHLWLAFYFAELSLIDGMMLVASIAASSVYGWRGETRSLWQTHVLPAVAAIGLSVAAALHAAILLARALG